MGHIRNRAIGIGPAARNNNTPMNSLGSKHHFAALCLAVISVSIWIGSAGILAYCLMVSIVVGPRVAAFYIYRSFVPERVLSSKKPQSPFVHRAVSFLVSAAVFLL